MPTTDAYRCFQHTQGGRTASCIPHCYIFSSLTSFCKERQPYKRKLASYETPDNDKEQEDAPERRCSSRTFRYGYLVTT